MLRTLLDKGADPDSGDGFGWTPLYRASFGEDVARISILLRAGADVNQAH